MSIFELVGNDKKAYFENDDEVEVQSTDRVLVTLDYAKKAATWIVVPEGENPSNCVPQEDDYDGVINWLIEHDYDSPELIQARRDQLGLIGMSNMSEMSMEELDRRIDASYALFAQTGNKDFQKEGRELIKEYRARQGIPYSAP